jgi:hypothetical protein
VLRDPQLVVVKYALGQPGGLVTLPHLRQPLLDGGKRDPRIRQPLIDDPTEHPEHLVLVPEAGRVLVPHGQQPVVRHHQLAVLAAVPVRDRQPDQRLLDRLRGAELLRFCEICLGPDDGRGVLLGEVALKIAGAVRGIAMPSRYRLVALRPPRGPSPAAPAALVFSRRAR